MRVNGEDVVLGQSKTLHQYLCDHNYRIERVAVEINGEIVSKKMYGTTFLKKDDTIEIVHFVGGG